MTIKNTKYDTFTAANDGGLGYFVGSIFTLDENTVTTKTTKAIAGIGGHMYWSGSASSSVTIASSTY